MKKIFISIFVFITISFISCKTEEKQSGYNCSNGNCTAVFDNPQYLTLSDCQSACGSSSTAGYNCVSNNCVSVNSNAQYSTLSACQSACGGSSGGYNCSSGNCISVTSGAQYSTLSACQSACGGGTGTVVITATWTTTYVSCNPAYTVVIGLGYTSTDVANEAYFAQSGSNLYSPATYTNSTLAPGTYYYKAKKTYNASTCGTGQGIPPTVTKSGAFTITAGQTTTVNAGSLN